MSRVSQEELYNDKDVVTQILKLKDTVNDYAGGIIENIDISGNDLVIDWADGTNISLPLPAPTEIVGISASVIAGNLSITLLMSDGSSHTVVTPLTNLMTTDTEQTITAKKIFSADVEVPTVPAGDDSAVNSFYVNDSTGTVNNNLLHKDGNETKNGNLSLKTSDGTYLAIQNSGMDVTAIPATQKNSYMAFRDVNGQNVVQLRTRVYSNGLVGFRTQLFSKYNNNYDGGLQIGLQATGESYLIHDGTVRSFDPANTTQYVTIGMLIAALQQYGLIP